MPQLDVRALRARFPALSRMENGRPFVFFDGPGGTQVPDTVIDAVVRYYRESNANAVGAWVYVDAVHYAPHVAMDVQAVDADFVVASTYKFFGPHLGALYGRRELLQRLPSYKIRPAVDRFETGTGNFEGQAGALAAVEYIADVGRSVGPAGADTSRRQAILAGMGAIRDYEMHLFGRLAAGLRAIPGVRLY